MNWKELTNLGNINKDFTLDNRIVLSLGHLVTSTIALKEYLIYRENEGAKKQLLTRRENFLMHEIEKNQINPKLGMGFVIFSDKMLNVARWDNKDPSVLVNSLYEFPKGNQTISKTKKIDINEFGAYCVWELGIVNHERRTWMNYLVSNREHPDKIKYLNDFLVGGLK